MKIHQITIKDIARELGVSISTVSRALKDHPDISPQTKQLVRDLVEKMKYKPNAIALSLTKPTYQYNRCSCSRNCTSFFLIGYFRH